MFDNNKNHDEFHEETNTQNEQEIGHYEYHKEAPKQPQDHKKKKMSSAKCTGIAAASCTDGRCHCRSRTSDERKHG